MIRIIYLSLVLIANAAVAHEKPNILLMMVDDLGFSDFGCYGSEIETPRIDRLAEEGLRFSQFYNTARCSPSSKPVDERVAGLGAGAAALRAGGALTWPDADVAQLAANMRAIGKDGHAELAPGGILDGIIAEIGLHRVALLHEKFRT